MAIRKNLRIENYKLLKPLGSGRFSTVWSTTDRSVVVKMHSKKSSAAAEIEHYNNVGEHPNVISFISGGFQPPHLVLSRGIPLDQFASGGCLAKRGSIIPRTLQMQTVKKMAKDLFAGLAHIHSRNYIHGDIKPQNLIWDGTNVRISDLGSSISEKSHRTFLLGTREYSAPEIILGVPYDCSIDVWAACTTVYELLCGEVLFDIYDFGNSGRSNFSTRSSSNSADSSGAEDENQTHEYNLNYNSLMLYTQILGPLPLEWRKNCTYYYNVFGELKNHPRLFRSGIAEQLSQNCEIDYETAKSIQHFLSRGLKYIADNRGTASQLSFDPWLQ